MKTVYITGIAGLIGSSLAKYYLQKQWRVCGCDNLVGGYESNIPNKVEFRFIDILDTDALDSDIESIGGVDVIIHTAALAYEGLSVFSPALITNSIYTGTVSVATAAINNHVPLMINCSSMARYGNIIPPFRENMVCNPVDPYGMAKLQAESQLELLSHIYPDFKFYTVVPHNVSGAHQVYTDPYRNVLSIMIHQALAERTIYIYGDGSQTRSFSHVDDCVLAIDKIIYTLPKENIFNIGPDDNEISITNLAQRIKSITKSSSTIKYLDPRPREVKHAWCSSLLARSTLGYYPNKNLDTIIDDIQSYIKLQGIKDYDFKLPIQINSDNIPKTWTDARLFNE